MNTQSAEDENSALPPAEDTAQESAARPRHGSPDRPKAKGIARRVELAVALAWLAVGVASVWVSTSLSWLVTRIGTSAPNRLFRQDMLARNPSTYEVGLLNWPYLAAAGFIAAGLTLGAAWYLRKDDGPSRTWILTAWAIAVYASFLSALVGFRWLGFILARAADPGPTWLYPGVAPSWLAVVGTIGLVGCGLLYPRLAPKALPVHQAARRFTARLALTAALVLVSLALLPTLKSTQDPVYRFDELTLAAFLEGSASPGQEVAQAFYWAHVALWVTLGGALLAWALLREVPAATPPAWKRLAAKASLALVVPVIGFVVATISFYVAASAVEATMVPTFAYVLPLGSSVLAIWCVLWGMEFHKGRRDARAGPGELGAQD
jgi:hypothetical protein